MSSGTSSDAIRRIKEAVDLPALVQEYTQMRRSAGQHLIVCPWHKDHVPSCRVYKDHLFCYVCSKHGSCFDVVMHFEGLSFREALKLLSQRTGIPLDARPQSRIQRQYDREETQFTAWCFARNLRAMQRRLSWMLLSGDEDEVLEQAGLLVQGLRALKPQERRQLAARAQEWERGMWRRSVEFNKWFAEVWLGLASTEA